MRWHRLLPLFGLTVSLFSAAAPVVATGKSSQTQLRPSIAVVYVGLDGKSKLEQGAFEALLLEQQLPSARLPLLVTEAYEGQAAEVRAKAVDAATAKMLQGQKALDDLDNQKATELLEESVALLRSSDLRFHFDLYLKALTLKAASHAVGGEQAEVKKDIVKLLALQPKAEFAAQYFSPDLVRFAEQQRKARPSGKEPSELTVRSDPPGASIWVDGTFRGTAPVTVQALNPGKHLVSAALGGFELTQVEASPGTELVTLASASSFDVLLRTREVVLQNPNSAARDMALRQLGKALGVEQVLVVLVKKALVGEPVDVTLMRLAVADGHNLAYLEKSQVRKADLGALLARALRQDDGRRNGVPVTHFAGSGDGGSVRKVVGFSLMGAGLALIATGVVTGLQASSAQREFEATPQTSTTISDNIKSRGRVFSVIADVSYILGAAGLVGGGVVALTGGKSADSNVLDHAPAKPSSSARLERPTEKPPSAKVPEAKPEVKPETKVDDVKPAAGTLTPQEKKKRDEEERQKRLQVEQEAFEREEAEARAAEAAAKKKTEPAGKTESPSSKKKESATTKPAEPAPSTPATTTAEPKKAEPTKADAKKDDLKTDETGTALPAVDRKAEEIERKRREAEEKKKKAEQERKKNAQEDDLKNF